MSRNLVVAIVLVAVMSAGCGGGGDGPADSGSDADTSIVAGSGGSAEEDDPVVLGSPTAESDSGIVSGSETDDGTDGGADGGGDSQVDEEAVGDRWGWCADWAGVRARDAAVLAADAAVAEARRARFSAESSFESARAEAAHETARDALSAAEAALENAQSAWEDALESAKDAAVANNDEEAYLAAEIVLAVIHDQFWFDQIKQKVLEAPETIISPQIASVTSEYHIAHTWFYGASQNSPSSRAAAVRQAAEVAGEVGFPEAPVWAAAAVAAEAAADAEIFHNWTYVVVRDPETPGTYLSETYWVAEAARAEQWAAAAEDAVWVYYNATDSKTRQDAAAWAARIHSESPQFSWFFPGQSYMDDIPSPPPAPPQSVSDVLEGIASASPAASTGAVDGDVPAPAEEAPAAAARPTPSPEQLALRPLSASAEAADRSSFESFEQIRASLSNAILRDLCDG